MDPNLRPYALFNEDHPAVLRRACDWIAAEPGIDDVEIPDWNARARQYVQSAGAAGLLSVFVPDAGADAKNPYDIRSICLVREALAYHCGLADAALVTQGICAVPIRRFGSDDQRKRWLPDLAAGRAIPAFGLSEPHGASDVANIKTTATRDGNHYVLNGAKTWTSNAGIADVYIVFARTGDAPGAKGLSAFLVEADTPGLTVGEQIVITEPHPMASVSFENCRVPASAMLGQSGEGFRVAMSTLDVFRTTVGAFGVGLARRAFDETVSRMKQRELYGQRMSEMPTVQMIVAEMHADLAASASLVYHAAEHKDRDPDARESLAPSTAKFFASEACFRVVDKAVQLHGGTGLTRGHIVERLFREIRAIRIYEGASEVQKIVIGRNVLR
ncbi:MAG: acyl-CoA dehydrogenase family protein [Sagittula sp.]|uniref:acyl-CoA dehydrogenase family protein n=1 Tax=Sagittula sp. TaxID=2038081 RepID=UPI004059DFF1